MTLVIILAVGLVAALGYIFYQNMNSSSSKNNTSSVSQTSNTNTTASSTTNKPSLEIKEWGVKIEFDDAAKVTYKLSSLQLGAGDPETAIKFIDSIKIYLVSSVTENQDCQDLGIGINRYSPLNEELRNSSIDGYIYKIGGGPGLCGGDSSVESLRNSILSEELGKGKYTIVSTKK